MRQITYTLLISVFLLNLSIAQNDETYEQLIKEAEGYYESEQFKESAQAYAKAFAQVEGEPEANDRYNAACSYALSGDKENAFKHLYHLAESPDIKYHNYWHIATDLDLDSLHDMQRWAPLMRIVKSNKDEYEGVENEEVVLILDSVFISDQRARREYSKALEIHIDDSLELAKATQYVMRIDSINMVRVSKILRKYGWLGTDVVGRSGSNAIFLTVQHAKLDSQLKYLPMIREAVKKGDLEGGALAMLEDRVRLRQGKKQIYGSQIGRDAETGESYVSPMIRPEKVNKRRAEVGLGPIEDYVKRFGITWDVEKHKERSKSIELKKN